MADRGEQPALPHCRRPDREKHWGPANEHLQDRKTAAWVAKI